MGARPKLSEKKSSKQQNKQPNTALRTMYLRDHNSGVLETYLGAALEAG